MQVTVVANYLRSIQLSWCILAKKKWIFLILVILSVLLYCLVLQLNKSTPSGKDIIIFADYEIDQSSNETDGSACPMPKLKPYSKVVLKHLAKQNWNFTSCDKTHEYPFLFNSTLEGEIVPVNFQEFAKLGIVECCYREVRRGPRSDNDFM